MIALGILVIVAAGFVVWDRLWAPASTTPDRRLIGVGIALAVVGAIASFLFWWLYVPILVLLAGGVLIVLGRHRDVAVP